MKRPNTIILRIAVEIDGQCVTVSSADYTESFHQRMNDMDRSWKDMTDYDLVQEVWQDYQESHLT